MAITILEDAKEEGTYVLSISFLDEDSNAVIPNSATWTLSDPNGIVVNNKQNVNITPLAATVQVVLTGDDLALDGITSRVRRFTVKALYDSTLGTNLALNDEVQFTVEDFVNVT